jgi:hypothetical protein
VSSLVSASLRRVPLLAAALAVSVSVSGCFIENRVQRPTTADGEQLYVDAGPLTYQVQLTRELNPYATEDVGYLAGVPAAQSIGSTQLWFAVFLWAKNQGKQTQTTTDNFQIVDSEGTVYHPVTLNPASNPYAWTSQPLGPNDTEPAADTTASQGPTQGGLLLFKLDSTVFSNRPLTLDIFAAGQANPTKVTLDL